MVAKYMEIELDLRIWIFISLWLLKYTFLELIYVSLNLYEILYTHKNFTYRSHWTTFLLEYKYVFPDDILVWLLSKKQVDYKIKVIPGSTPTCKVLYRLALNEMEECKTQMHKMLSKGFIKPKCFTLWSSSALFEEKI